MYVDIDKKGKLQVHTDYLDLCYCCKNLYKCPLILSIHKEIVILHYSDIEIKECPLFKK